MGSSSLVDTFATRLSAQPLRGLKAWENERVGEFLGLLVRFREDTYSMQGRPINKVLELLEDYTERGDEIRARCPAHNGTSEDSLSIRETENGDVLLHCHAECENEDIVEALDLDLADLFSKNGKASKPLTKEAQPADVRTVDELPGVIEDYFTFEDEEGKLLRSEERRVGKECRSGWSPD